MATINVTWDAANSKPTASDITVTGTNDVTITWVPDSTVTITGITTPSDGNSNHDDFTTPAKVKGSNNWQCTDNMANDGDYSYTISGSSKLDGAFGSHDPQIRNDRNG